MRTKRLKIATLTLLVLCYSSFSQAAEEMAGQYYLIEYSPDMNWKEGLSYEKQPKIQAHLNFLQQLYYHKIMLMNGPFLDKAGSVVLLMAKDRASVEEILAADPAVKSRLMKPTIQAWRVITSSIRKVQPRPLDLQPNEKFSVKRLTPDSPITLERIPEN